MGMLTVTRKERTNAELQSRTLRMPDGFKLEATPMDDEHTTDETCLPDRGPRSHLRLPNTVTHAVYVFVRAGMANPEQIVAQTDGHSH